jgi:hypothetical protein
MALMTLSKVRLSINLDFHSLKFISHSVYRLEYFALSLIEFLLVGKLLIVSSIKQVTNKFFQITFILSFHTDLNSKFIGTLTTDQLVPVGIIHPSSNGINSGIIPELQHVIPCLLSKLQRNHQVPKLVNWWVIR